MDFLKKPNSKIKNTLLFVLTAVFVFFGIVSPLPVAAGLLTSALLSLPGLFLALLGFFTNLFAQLAVVVFSWVTGPAFISWGYTQNPVIEAGLNITKNFVNMGLVVALVFIALAITLRLEEYATQKTLVRLIFIALLVNFAPVIVGLIVDASNIIMNYFLTPIQTGVNNILGGISGSFSTFLKMMSIGDPPAKQLGVFGQLGVAVIFNAIIGFTFSLLALIFIVRYLAIWVLVILSPLAFVAWILPATKKFWDQWWKQLIQWSIIGIPLAFFVYLAINSFGAISIAFNNKMPGAGLDPGTSAGINYFNEFFGYMVVVIIIWIGIIVGLQSSAMGSEAITRGGKAGYKEMAKTGRKWTKQGAGTTKRAAASTLRTAARIGASMKETYDIARLENYPKGAAMQEAVKVQWDRTKGRAKQAIERAKQHPIKTTIGAVGTVAKPILAVSKGALSGVKDVARASWRAAMKSPKKRKLSKKEREGIIKGEEEIEEKSEE